MSKDDYKVFGENIKEADGFEVLILQLPEGDIEDKLAYLAKEKGQIPKNGYEDFIIATCVANINQLLFNLNQQDVVEPPDLKKVREELIEKILIHNPKLDPTKLVINKNHVIKMLLGNKPTTGEKLLINNKAWDTPDLEDIDAELKALLVDEGIVEGDIDATVSKNDQVSNKDLDDLPYSIEKKWWNRINRYVKIKRFSPDDVNSILKGRYFHNRTSFSTFVVSVCLVEFEELFNLLDGMGIPSRVAPPLLMHELYELCAEFNNFLTFETSRKYTDEHDKSCESFGGAKKKSGMEKYTKNNLKKDSEHRFKDVPKEDLLKLADSIKVSLIGQNEAVEILVDSIQRASVGLKHPNKPIGSFLFAGRTGVGKTECCKVLADELIKGRDNLITIDCSEYSADHEYSKLIGAPSGYVGHEAGGLLTNAIAKNPFSIVVFDEVEKASKKVHELLLQILDEGRLTDGKGKTVNFSDVVIIMTSNVGVDEVERIKKTIGFCEVAKLTEDKKEVALDKALKKKFKPEFLNRVDSVIHFSSLSNTDFMQIIDIELYKLNDNLRSNATEYSSIWLEFDKKIKNLIFKEGIDEEYGARPLKRSIEKIVSTPLARKFLAENIDKKATIKVSAVKGDAKFTIVGKKKSKVKTVDCTKPAVVTTTTDKK